MHPFAAGEDGKLVPPLLLVGGEFQLPFDEIETLRATVTTVTPLAGNEENLRASIDVARQFLAIPGLATAPAVAEGLTTRIREAWSQGKRVVAPGYLDAQTERVLIRSLSAASRWPASRLSPSAEARKARRSTHPRGRGAVLPSRRISWPSSARQRKSVRCRSR